MDDEEDPIELEVNVHLSKAVRDNLYLLQYPVRPKYMNYDNVDLLSAKVKPVQKKLQLEVALNTASRHYASSKGEQIAINVDGRNPDSSSVYTSGMMDKQVLDSCPTALGDSGRYSVAYFKQGELFICPLSAQLQMKPSFDYLDKADVKIEKKAAEMEGGQILVKSFSAGFDSELLQKSFQMFQPLEGQCKPKWNEQLEAQKECSGSTGESSQDEGEDEAQAVTVQFARPESEVAKAKRLASFNHMQKQQEEEQWVPLAYKNIHTYEADRERNLLMPETKDASNEFHVDCAEYLKMLTSHVSEVQTEKPAMPDNVLSLTQLKSMPLNDQVKALLTNAKVIRFGQLMQLLPQGTDIHATLRALQNVAVLVQGCWVVKSEILYPKDVCSPNSGISSELLCRGRDFLMWRFTQSRCVTRKEIASVIKLPSEDVKEILEQMSRIRVNHGWEFVFSHDYDFTDRHTEICDRQKMLWDAKYRTLGQQLHITEAQEKKIREAAAAEALTERPRRRRTSSRSSRKRTLSGRSISDHSDMELETEIDLALKEAASQNIQDKHSALNGTTMEITDEQCFNNVSDDLRKELRKFIQEKLFSRYVLSLSELRHLLNIKLTQSPPGCVLGSGVTDRLCEQTVIELGCISLNAKWQQEMVFLHVKSGDETEPIRQAISEMLKTSYKMTRKNLVKKVEAMIGQSISDSEVKPVIKDYFVHKCGTWCLKCCETWT